MKSFILTSTLFCLIAGCDNSTTGPFGKPAAAPILKPFEGSWRFNLNKTLAQWQADGVSAQEIAQVRTIAKAFSPHPDMKIAADTAILPGRVEGEYKFFALHPHNQSVCGKAWHHEDRHDPGDMSKCLVRLEIKGGDLHMALRLDEDSADPNDPDVTNVPLLAGSAASCGADAAPTPQWSPWRTYVFERAGDR